MQSHANKLLYTGELAFEINDTSQNLRYFISNVSSIDVCIPECDCVQILPARLIVKSS